MSTSFVTYQYDLDGNQQSPWLAEDELFDEKTLAEFTRKLSRLSGDLDLPLEGVLPGDMAHLEYRIGSEDSGAYVLYYLHDEVILLSLLLPGIDEESEDELMQIFRFLLLDRDHLEDPTEEEIEEVLGSPLFDLTEIDARPVMIVIQPNSNDDEQDVLEHVHRMNRHLATSFFKLRPKPAG